jgi:hypothetical protein
MRYFLGFLVAIGLIILVIILVVRGLSGGHHAIVPATSVADYADTATVMRLTIDGPVVANDQHKAVRITIGRDQNQVEVIQGYQGDVMSSQQYDNNQAAYTVFLKALQLQGYTNGDPDPARADERGFCPQSKRYIYEIVSPGGATVQRYWSSECKVGTFRGNGILIRNLFRLQIPDYQRQIRGTGL